MNFNIQCDDFKTNLVKIINQSNLPIAVIYYILQNIYIEVENSYINTINQIRLDEQNKEVIEEEQEENK